VSEARRSKLERRTAETLVSVELLVDGRGQASIATGVGFLDHLLASFAKHARLDLTMRCEGDLEVDDHHTAEDAALALGQALDEALGDRRGISRFGDALVLLDGALARAAGSRGVLADIQLGLKRDAIGALSAENVSHVLRSFATAARLTLHVDVLKGENDHHRAESAFKATAVALRQAVTRSGFGDIPSTKESCERGRRVDSGVANLASVQQRS
jgi:imidazoleglycerol-phosphate dehydratase